MILYVTYNDQPSGVYWSQVTDVVDHLNTLGKERVQLVALVSLRGYFRSRRAIRERHPGAMVLPMVPRAHNWRINWVWLWLLCRTKRPSGIIGRGIFATALALRMRDRGLVDQVCFDARAAYGAEWQEYRVVDDDRLIAECVALEKEVVAQADLRLAVSNALVRLWQETMDYRALRHLVVPCTLGRSVEIPQPGSSALRDQLGWAKDDTVLVYSGTSVGWQSLGLAEEVVRPWLGRSGTNRILFLSPEHEVIARMSAAFPGQVHRQWVPHQRVRALLQECDIGLLLRETRITNRVASPTKFAEYLSAGLYVAISEEVGDFSAMVREHSLGQAVGKGGSLLLEKPDSNSRQRLAAFARDHFVKECFDGPYRTILGCVSEEPFVPAPSPFVRAGAGSTTVSIIVPSFNKRGFIGDMVRSVLAQTDPRWELIIVDDASTDGSVELLRGFEATDERVKVIALEENRGANHCRNLGIERASGQYIIFLDADDLFAPHCVERRLAVMEGSALDFSVSTMEVFRERPGDHGQQWVPLSAHPLFDFFSHQLPWQTMQPIWDRDFLLGLGGFDNAFSRHQDVELHTRALLQPGVHFRMRRTTPDCHYRIAEERKVIDPRRLMRSFSESAVLYRNKFLSDARRFGRPALLLGIIHRTHLQILLHAKNRRIDRSALSELEKILFDNTGAEPLSAFERGLFRFSRWYNLLPLRIPGVNLLVFQLLTGGRERVRR